MTKLESVLGMGAAMSAVMVAMSGCSRAVAQPKPEADRAIELTVYKEDFAMVSERRPATLETGHSRLVISDISKQLDPNSVLFEWPSSGTPPEVVATTYDLGVGNGATLLSRLNGQQVDMIWPSNDGKPGETITGRLEAAQQGYNYALRTKDKLYVNPGGTIVASADAQASTIPQLSIELENRGVTHTKLGMSYLTGGMSWSADYVAKLQAHSDKAELQCWATVTNTTGIPFPSARLTLMAGSPNRSISINQGLVVGGTSSTGTVTLDSAVAPSGGVTINTRNAIRMPVGESYAYQIPSPATIGQDQMNRVSVLGTRIVPIKRDYAIRIPTLGDSGFATESNESRPHTSAVLSILFVNDQASHLGVPLPSGSVRVYEKDSGGQERYTGAASMGDTPKREHVSLTLSNVFDVYAGYRVLESKRMGKHLLRKTVETTIHNEKATPVVVRVVQSYESRWSPVSETIKSEKLDSSTVQWKVPIKAGEDRTVKYVVDIRG